MLIVAKASSDQPNLVASLILWSFASRWVDSDGQPLEIEGRPQVPRARVGQRLQAVDTAGAARQIAAGAGREAVILQGKILPTAWTGKLWALHQGIIHAQTMKPSPHYLLLTGPSDDQPNN